jgi:hypothetical protein
LTWGWHVSLRMALIVVPLLGLPVFKPVAESRSADVPADTVGYFVVA